MRHTVVIIFLFLSLLSTISADNRALLVGIGKYDTRKTGWSVIHGDNDVDMLTKCLIRNGYKEGNIRCLKNEQATKAAIVNALKELAKQCLPGDKIFFHFSGHGQPISDLNRDEKKKPFDEAIVPYDACRTRRYKISNHYYNGENHLTDDELNHLLNDIKKRLGNKGYLFVSFDACYSEGLEMAKSMIKHDDVKKIGPIRGTAEVLKISRDSKVARNPMPKKFSKGALMVAVSACRDYERNYEYREQDTKRIYGSLSYCLNKLIDYGLSSNKWKSFFEEENYKFGNQFVRKVCSMNIYIIVRQVF